jgi:hypothetical protein
VKGSGRGLILRHYSSIFLEGLNKTTNTVRIDGLREKISNRDMGQFRQLPILTVSIRMKDSYC